MQDRLNQESNADDVMNDLDVNPENSESMDDDDSSSLAKEADPLNVKKRLGMQAKKHQRELRSMRDELMQMHAKINQNQSYNSESASQDTHASQGMSIEDQIQRGVRFALQAKDEQERKHKEAERLAHVHRQYQHLDNAFDQASEKYEDFDDVVRGHGVPFTETMRDALLLIDNPGEVAYKLGKNNEELLRISKLHPLDQAREVNRMSFALMGGNRASSVPNGNGAKPMNPMKPNPVNSSASNSASSIRSRMKSGSWK